MKHVKTLNGHKAAVLCCAFNSEVIVSGSTDSTIKLWNIQGGLPLATLDGHHSDVKRVELLDTHLVSCSDDASAKLWDWTTGQLVRSFAGHRKGVWCVLPATETSIYTGSDDKTVKQWVCFSLNRLNEVGY